MLEYRTKNGKGEEIVINGASSFLDIKNNTVTFLGEKYADRADEIVKAKNCLIFSIDLDIPEEVRLDNDIRIVENPRESFGKFLMDQNAEKKPETKYIEKNGSWISVDAKIGVNVKIYPMVFIDRDVVVGDNSIIHSGAHLLPDTKIGKNCHVGDNTVIGQLDIAYEGTQRIPQIGGVTIEDDVFVGSNAIISKGAIDDTKICRNAVIDAGCYISHNDVIGARTTIVGHTIIFGSVNIGEDTLVSGNVSVRNARNIGSNCTVGMGSVVVKDVADGETVLGNPAKAR